MDDLLAEFVTETAESLAELDAVLLKLEQAPDDQPTLSRIFRLLHTIKGTCGFLGLNRLERLAHAVENVLSRLRDGEVPATGDTVNAILLGLDGIRRVLDGVSSAGHEPVGEDGELLSNLANVAAGRPGVSIAPPPQSGAATGQALGNEAATPQSIRLGVTLLEELMTLVGELVLTRNQILRIANSEPNPALVAPLQRLSHITTELQEGVLKTRMQPIGAAWNKLPRLVRDLSRELGKNIELELLGTDTELDRQVLELVRDPITHMVRNSADHGVESLTERRAFGKPDTGRITLNAFHEGGHIIIEVSDDGAGLRIDRIRARAQARGLATEAELSAMPDADIHRFIFHPGFSTATAITSVSGRGVGMDVVKTNVERIGGTIDLHSRPGCGTIFTIKIPLTLAIIPALIVAAGECQFAIPQISVVELVRTREAMLAPRSRPCLDSADAVVERIEQSRMLRLRNQLLPLITLTDLLQLPASTEANSDQGFADIVVVQIGASRFGLVVDQIYDAEEIVVKPVAPILRTISLFSGNTILGDGSVIMILDTNAIARMVGIGAGTATEPRVEPPSIEARSSEDRTAMLVFRAGAQRRMAVPLGLVARLETMVCEQIDSAGGSLLTHYRGRLMKLIPLAAETLTRAPDQKRPVLVFSDQNRNVGLIVDEIIDVVEQRLDIEMVADRPGFLGVAMIAGQASDVIDTSHWLTRAHPDWFSTRAPAHASSGHILIVDDNDFFRHLLLAELAAQGYRVTAAASGAHALQLRDAGKRFDAIVSDIAMPGMSGQEFARQVRGGGPWAGLPLIALTARGERDDWQGREDAGAEAGRQAGFTEVVRKQDHDALLTCLRRHLDIAWAA